MILGLGNDIIGIDRIRRAIDLYGDRFLNRLFTPFEQEYCLRYKDPVKHYAGRFAGKEAVVKSLGIGFTRGITWLDIEIQNAPSGQPYVICSSALSSMFNNPSIKISISHCDDYATAIAIWTQ
jgi:holo-[acyl-carrier protein] synthase